MDDDPVAADVLKGYLSRAGAGQVEARFSPDAEGLLKLLASERPKVAILDIKMPGVDGIALCHTIKSHPELSRTKVVIHTSKFFEQDRQKALKFGADDYIVKGESPDAVVRRVLALISGAVAVRFWGVRGSLPTPSPGTARYGGNTSCVGVSSGEHFFIFDAGTGIRELGAAFLKGGHSLPLHLFLSHCHWDHIQGLPFFPPAYQARQEIHLYGCEEPDLKLNQILAFQMQSPYFPIPIKGLAARFTLHPLQEGAYKVGPATVRTLYLNHPGNALGYRVEWDGRKILYVTDNELASVSSASFVPDPKLLEFCRGADLLIHDAQYTDAEYGSKRGWGHSTWSMALKLAMASQVKACALFHHDPDHTDEDLDKVTQEAQDFLKQSGGSLRVTVAAEGSEVRL